MCLSAHVHIRDAHRYCAIGCRYGCCGRSCGVTRAFNFKASFHTSVIHTRSKIPKSFKDSVDLTRAKDPAPAMTAAIASLYGPQTSTNDLLCTFRRCGSLACLLVTGRNSWRSDVVQEQDLSMICCADSLGDSQCNSACDVRDQFDVRDRSLQQREYDFGLSMSTVHTMKRTFICAAVGLRPG